MEQPDNSDTETIRKIARDVIDYLINHPKTSREKITNIKGRFGKQHQFNKVLKNATILVHANEEEKQLINHLLKRRSTRTLSGVSVIAIMTEPLPCPGTCVYCPGADSQPFEKVAQSYTGREPAAMRSIHCNYDPYKQVRTRIEDLEAIGHKVDKTELILMGGTLLSCSEDYQKSFVKGALEAIIDRRVQTLEEAIEFAESSKRRIIGLTVETRPDYCKQQHVDVMLNYGTTRVELGIQTVYDEIFKRVKRGHTTKESKEAIRIAKDAGLKINAHVMPNLPGSNLEKDQKLFTTLFSDPSYRPDMLKIYPTVVVKGTELYDWWKSGEFKPYELEDLIDLLAKVKKDLPPYVRIQRLMRDIPATLIEAGCKHSNLRQMVKQQLKKNNQKCSCIRCREVGISKRGEKITEESLDKIKLYRLNYEANQGQEIFLSFENKEDDYLVGYLRIRKPSELAHRPELNDGKTMIVREIKVVGQLVPRNQQPSSLRHLQHRGFGSDLMKNAEMIAKDEFDSQKLAVISGIGVRDYFYAQGYKLDGPYVSKQL